MSVIAFHYTVRWAPPMEPTNLYGYDTVFPTWLKVGAYGVHLFFVISGLVITMTLLRSASVWEFAARRFARIYPAFVVAAAITFVLMQFGPERFRVGISDFLYNLLLDARVFGHKPVDGVYWSLVVEVKFYAFVLLARLVLGDRFWVGLAGFAVASAIALQIDPRLATAIMLAPYWPFFLLGIGGWLLIFERRVIDGSVLFATAVALYGITYGANHAEDLAPLLVDAFIGCTALAMLAALAASPSARIPILAPLGRISYSLYLVHQCIGVSLIGILTAAGQPDWLAMTTAIGAMIGLAALLFRYVEQPGNAALMNLYRFVTHDRGLATSVRG